MGLRGQRDGGDEDCEGVWDGKWIDFRDQEGRKSELVGAETESRKIDLQTYRNLRDVF